jgi:signal peptidase I
MPVIRAALGRGQRVRLTVTGSSMLPFLRDNDLVELEPAPAPRLGDLVLVQTNPPGTADRYVLHRLVRLVRSLPAEAGAALLIRGDAQRQSEGPFPADALLGRVTAAWHQGRARNLNHGWWRWAGLVWMRCSPLGFWLLWLAARLRGLASRVLRWLQQFPTYRAWAGRLRPEYAIREANQSDLMALHSFHNASGEQALRGSERTTNPRLTSYVARSGGQVLGSVHLMRHPETDSARTGYWLYSLTVRARYRGMGLGAALTQRVIDQSRSEGATELFLDVFEDNAPAVRLYRKLGFEPVTLPALEGELATDVEKPGRRRSPLRKQLD